MLPIIASAAPATMLTSGEAEKVAEEHELTAQAALLPLFDVKSLADVVRAEIIDDRLIIRFNPPPAVGIYRVPTGMPHWIATLRRFPTAASDPTATPGCSLDVRDFSGPWDAAPGTTISSVGPVNIAREYELGSALPNVSLTQDVPVAPGGTPSNDDPIRVLIHQLGNESMPESQVKLSAASFAELRRKYPHEVEQYLRPVFSDLGIANVLAPDTASGWEILAGDWKPSSKEVEQVQAIVQQLNAEMFADRRQAMKSLHDMGETAALILQSADGSKWTAEQRSAIDTFLKPYLPLTTDDVKRLGGDSSYLLNLQYCDDLALRKLAAARLAKILNLTTTVDPAAPDASRAAAVEQFRSAHVSAFH